MACDRTGSTDGDPTAASAQWRSVGDVILAVSVAVAPVMLGFALGGWPGICAPAALALTPAWLVPLILARAKADKLLADAEKTRAEADLIRARAARVGARAVRERASP